MIAPENYKVRIQVMKCFVFFLDLQIFQPLLLEYFTYEELCELKRKVIDFHSGKASEGFEKGLREEAEKEESTEDSCTQQLGYFLEQTN